MTSTVPTICLLSLFLLGMTTLAAKRSLPLLASTNAILMTCVPLLGSPTFVVFGYATNVGSIFFAIVMYGLSLKHLRFGATEAHGAFNAILFAMLLVFGSIFLLQEAQVLSPMFATPIRIFGASFVSFCLVQPLFLTLLDRAPKQYLIGTIPIITIVMQGVDSAVFFPCAFAGQLPPGDMLQFAIVGWLSKAAVAVLSIPFLIWLHRTTQMAERASA